MRAKRSRNHAPTNQHFAMLIAQHHTQARALAALQIKMTPVVKSSSPHALADGNEPAPPPPSRRASSPAAAPPSAASLHLLTAAAAAEGRDAAMDTDEEKEVRDRGDRAATVAPSPLLQPCLSAFPRRQAKRTGCMLACPRFPLPPQWAAACPNVLERQQAHPCPCPCAAGDVGATRSARAAGHARMRTQLRAAGLT